jgi:predicted nucleic acid-binding protein
MLQPPEFALNRSTPTVQVTPPLCVTRDERPDEVALPAIDAFWLPPSPVKAVEFHRLVARDARDLVREVKFDADKGLKPPDAVHLASAARMNVEEFHTYDGDLLKLTASLPFKIVQPWTPSPKLPGMG